MADLLTPIENIPSGTLLKSAEKDKNHFEKVNREYTPLNVIYTPSGTSIVWIVQSKMPRRKFAPTLYAIKKQLIAKPTLEDKAYRELRISLRLRQLWETHRSPNFVRVFSWFKTDSQDEPFRAPPLPSPPSSSSAPSCSFGDAGDAAPPPSARASPTKSTPAQREALYYLLEYADTTLDKFKPQSLHQYRSVLFQLINALFTAQQNCNFMHNDLHLRNILIQDMPDVQMSVFYDHGTAWYVTGPIVKISDFGLSRCQVGNEVIYNPAMSYSEMFSALPDLVKVFHEFRAPRHLFENEEDLAPYRDLRSAAARGMYPLQLIHHSFFEPLQTRPPAAHAEDALGSVLYFSCDGSVRNQSDLESRMAQFVMEAASLQIVLECKRDELLHHTLKDFSKGNRIRFSTESQALFSPPTPPKKPKRRIPRTPTTVALPPTAIPSSAGSEFDPPAVKRRRAIHTDPGYIRKFEHSRAPPSLDIQDQLFDTMTKPMSLSRQLAQLEAQARLQRAARQLSSVQPSSLKSDSQTLSASSSSSSTMVSLPEEYDLLNGDDESASGLCLTPTRDPIILSHIDDRFDSSGARTFPRSSPSRVLSYQLPHLKSEALPSSGLSSPQPVFDLSTPVRPPIRSPRSQALSLSFQPSSSLPVTNDEDSLQFEDAESLVLPDSQSWITEDDGSISASTSRPEEMDEQVDIDGQEEEEEASSEEKEASSEETESFPLPPLPRRLAIPVVEPRSRPSRAPPAAVSSDRRMSLSRALRLIEEAQKQWVASSFEPPR